MPWQNPIVRKNTERDDTFGISVEFTDVAEFATNVFRYSESRIVNDFSGRTAFKTRANAAVEAERTRQQDLATKQDAILTFMNS